MFHPQPELHGHIAIKKEMKKRLFFRIRNTWNKERPPFFGQGHQLDGNLKCKSFHNIRDLAGE